MREAIISLDIGASLAKVVLVDEELRIISYGIFPSEELRETALMALNHIFNTIDQEKREKIRMILSTGGGSRFLVKENFGLFLKRIDEIKAIGLGGLALSGKKDCLVVSAGTGTALVVTRNGGKFTRHVGGTGVGGGTILGLSRRMLGVSDFMVLEEMALRGDLRKVDLMIGDLIGGPIGILPANVTASNFGKIFGEASADDIAAAIFNLVSQTIGVVSAMAAKAYGLEDSIVVTGMLAKNRMFSKIIHEVADLFSVKISIPENCELAGAIGAIVTYLQEIT
ncbi:MAG: pantothenate kinase [Candidatus Bathyarchaeia archaeon]